MAVYLDKNTKKWYYHFEIKDKITGQRKAIKKRGFTLKREAQKAEQEAKDLIQHKVMPFDKIFLERQHYKNVDEDTIHNRECNLKKNMQELYYKDIAKITKEDLLFINKFMEASDHKASTKNFVISNIKSVFRFAAEMYDLEDISKTLKNFKDRKNTEKEKQVWDIEEFNNFLKYVDNPIHKIYFYTLFYTGLRRGEALALTKDNLKSKIDPKTNNTIHYLEVRKSSHQNGKLKPTKNASSNRNVTITEEHYKMLKDLSKHTTKYLFGDTVPIQADNVANNFRKAIKRSENKKIKIHDLRHSHATILINNGINIVAVSKRLGHSNITTTLNTYTHLLLDTENTILDYIEKQEKSTLSVLNK